MNHLPDLLPALFHIILSYIFHSSFLTILQVFNNYILYFLLNRYLHLSCQDYILLLFYYQEINHYLVVT